MLTVYCKGNGGMSGTPAEPYRPVCQAACAAGHAASASSTFAHPHKTTAQDRLVLQRDRRIDRESSQAWNQRGALVQVCMQAPA